MTRLDPFGHAFAALAAQHFSEIQKEAVSLHKDTADLPQFTSLGTVQRLIDELESPEAVESQPEAAAEYMAGLYVAYRFWDDGLSIYPVSRERLEESLAALPRTEPTSVPNGSCYVQLPERWFWAQIDPDQPHEPVDGLFVVEGAHGREMFFLVILGLRADRPGFSQVSLVARPDDLARAVNEARTPFFAPTVEGGKPAGLKSLTTEADVLLLAQLGLQVVSGELRTED